MQAHVDVVRTGPEYLWSHAPYEPVIDGDWLFGRGAADMKAGHAANLFVLKALRRIGVQAAATLYLPSVVEEESTGNGALMAHLQGHQADAVLIPEPEDEKLVRANVGVLWFEHFDQEEHPINLNVGRIEGGDWARPSLHGVGWTVALRSIRKRRYRRPRKKSRTRSQILRGRTNFLQTIRPV